MIYIRIALSVATIILSIISMMISRRTRRRLVVERERLK